MLEFIKLSLICVLMGGAEVETESYLEQIFLFEDSYSQKKAKVTSYYAASSSGELQGSWELDYENFANYTTTNNGMITFTIPYNSIRDDEEQYYSEYDDEGVLAYIINPDTLRIKVTYIDQTLDNDNADYFGYCIEQKQR